MTKKFKVMLTFDVDGETMWTAPDADSDPRNAEPVTLSMGSYGTTVAMPRILKMLKDYEIKGSFFIPGATAAKYPEMVKAVHKEGHDIGNHGYTHMCPDEFKSKEEEVKEYDDANQILQKLTGQRPKGFRAPSWGFSKHTLNILEEMEFTYDSTMMGSDRMGRLEAYDQKADIVEIPINWSLDDAPYWLFSLHTWGAPMQPPSAVFEAWSEEFLYLYEESFDNCFTLTCHPQIIGRPGRLRMYERLIRFIKGHKNIEFTTCIDAAESFTP